MGRGGEQARGRRLQALRNTPWKHTLSRPAQHHPSLPCKSCNPPTGLSSSPPASHLVMPGAFLPPSPPIAPIPPIPLMVLGPVCWARAYNLPSSYHHPRTVPPSRHPPWDKPTSPALRRPPPPSSKHAYTLPFLRHLPPFRTVYLCTWLRLHFINLMHVTPPIHTHTHTCFPCAL